LLLSVNKSIHTTRISHFLIITPKSDNNEVASDLCAIIQTRVMEGKQEDLMNSIPKFNVLPWWMSLHQKKMRGGKIRKTFLAKMNDKRQFFIISRQLLLLLRIK
jgi:hypothetical protein